MSDKKANGFVKEVADKFTDQFATILIGAREDIEKYIAIISEDIATAIVNNDEKTLAELKGQVRLIAERHRVDAAVTTMNAIIEFIGALAGAAVKKVSKSNEDDKEKE